MKQSGFTLIETMIFIAILGICAAIFIPAWLKYERQKIDKVYDGNTQSPTMISPTVVPATPADQPGQLSPPK